ncbi:2',3'-cyclic-nucleotide 3'-phosphodiesterase [Fundulus heteroclitus]|uniref:2',3'-cyclic-nucleotide 3'-phosphodiesterase n=1 Tax=Fundulus heteroclitus TaxID=8078 RepID=UPI00165CDE6A|nr:2',3'-cyclic-nucleotide 3'-phosphodiesterase [Fundulus heteroclitus]
METEKSEVPDIPEAQNQEAAVMEPEEKPEAAVAPAEPENPPAAVGEADQLAANGHAAEVACAQETEQPAVAENATQENKDVVEDGAEKPEEEPVPCAAAPAESAESSEKASDPAAALDTKPESPERQPVPANNPEPVQAHLAAGAPESEPEKPAETTPQPAAQSPVEAEPEQAEPEQAKAESEMPAIVETREEAVPETAAPTEASPKKSAEAAAVEKEPSGPSGEPVQAEVTADKPEPVVPEEPAVKAEAVESVQVEPEAQKEKDPAPAPGSLSFPLLEHEETKAALRISRTLVVLRGLPGSGKSFLARAIADAYKDQCSVFCADDHGVKPDGPSADGYKALDEAVVARCGDGASSAVLIVVDDTNHAHDRLARLGEIAKEHQLVVVFLEPQTEWSRDPSRLKQKSGRGLEEARLLEMKAPLEETSLPLYFGWFLLSPVQVKIGCTAMDFLKTLDTLEAFKKHIADFTGEAEKEVDLEQYFQAKRSLHCTTKFCNYGKADGAAEYAKNPVVNKSYGSVSELSLTALFVTPRTVGARVSLTEQQLQLWPADAEKEPEAAVPGSAALPAGSRAHVTLGCAEGVQPVQTGLDLLQILTLPQGEVVEEMELGSLRYYGEGRWMLSLREPICAAACFSSFYGSKEVEVEAAKKEPEKKKKPKCSIL